VFFLLFLFLFLFFVFDLKKKKKKKKKIFFFFFFFFFTSSLLWNGFWTCGVWQVSFHLIVYDMTIRKSTSKSQLLEALRGVGLDLLFGRY